MSGAVDLAAVKARAEAAQRAAQAPAPSVGAAIVQVNEQNFQTQVLDRSFQVPVVVVFSSGRSPASAQLVASFTPLVQQRNGAVVLGVIDVDTELGVAQALQIRAVPTVAAVISGQLVPGFEGSLPAAQLSEFLDAVVKAGRDAGVGAASPADPDSQAGPDEGAVPAVPERPEDPRFDAAEAALADGDYATAAQRFQAIVEAEPANTDALAALAQVKLLQRVNQYPQASAGDPPADDVAGQLAAADLQLVADDVPGALRRLLDLLTRLSANDTETVRTRLLEFFQLLGPQDPRVPPARREMARALF
jgi:putative thioredoxin